MAQQSPWIDPFVKDWTSNVDSVNVVIQHFGMLRMEIENGRDISMFTSENY